MASEFHTTCWTMVLDAGGDDSQVRKPALEELCRRYWMPLHAYVRGHARSDQDAEDLTQSFFALLLEKNLPGRATPERGRFRAFLLTSARNFIHSELQKSSAIKRAGLGAALSLDDDSLGLKNTIPDTDTPERAYDRKWAHTVIHLALESLAAEQAALNQKERFEQLRPLIFEGAGKFVDQAALSARLGVQEGALRTMISRLRARFRDHIRAEVSRIVDDPADVDAELAHLLSVLRG
ncbi:MAG: sigma-70 family RNA polymerase sigma factor [Verrucomicrobiaceae bacterium]|nr:sigma-70 family RNA polymerase sigma factor [Verrucomicrobiaceae bacterium]